MPPDTQLGVTESPPVRETVLAVHDLRVEFRTEAGLVRAVDGVSWSVGAGEHESGERQ